MRDRLSCAVRHSMPREAHARLWRALRNAFNPSMLRGFHAAMAAAVDDLCERLRVAAARAARADIAEHFAAATFRVILNVAFGAEMSRAERVAFAADVERLNEELMRECVHMPVRARSCSR